MTADNAPSPLVASASTEFNTSGFGAWNAFDGATLGSEAGWTGTNHGVDWLQIFLGGPALLNSYAIAVGDGVRGPTTWTMEGSNDGSTWTTLDTQTGAAAWANAETRTFTPAAITVSYAYFRVNITAGGDGTYVNIAQLFLYETLPIIPAGIGPHGMTGDNTQSPFVASASSYYGSTSQPYYAFDNGFYSGGLPGGWWIGTGGGVDWLQIDMGSAVLVGSYAIQATNELLRMPSAWTWEGSNDGSTWTVLDTETAQTAWGIYQTRTYTCVGTTAYRYFRLNISANNGDPTYTDVGELFLYAPSAPPAPTQRGNIAYDQIKASDRTGNGNQLLTWSTTAPAHSTSTGVAGQISFDSAGNYYWCYAANSWARVGPGGFSTSW